MRKTYVCLTILLITSLFFPGQTFCSTQEFPPHIQKELQKITKSLGSSLQLQWDQNRNSPSFLAGSLTKPSRHSSEWIALQFFNKVKGLYGLTNSVNRLQVLDVSRSASRTIVRLQHYLFNTPVWGDELQVEIDQTGVIRRVHGTIHPYLERKLFYRPMVPSLSKKMAVSIALASLEPHALLVSNPEIAPYYLPTQDGSPLIYVVTIQLNEPKKSRHQVLIHALSGRVIAKKSL